MSFIYFQLFLIAINVLLIGKKNGNLNSEFALKFNY